MSNCPRCGLPYVPGDERCSRCGAQGLPAVQFVKESFGNITTSGLSLCCLTRLLADDESSQHAARGLLFWITTLHRNDRSGFSEIRVYVYLLDLDSSRCVNGPF